jgi:hypothetical protein
MNQRSRVYNVHHLSKSLIDQSVDMLDVQANLCCLKSVKGWFFLARNVVSWRLQNNLWKKNVRTLVGRYLLHLVVLRQLCQIYHAEKTAPWNKTRCKELNHTHAILYINNKHYCTLTGKHSVYNIQCVFHQSSKSISNKRPMGHIAHLSNTCSYENTFRILIYISFPFAPPDSQEPWFWQTCLCTMSESFHVNFSWF